MAAVKEAAPVRGLPISLWLYSNIPYGFKLGKKGPEKIRVRMPANPRRLYGNRRTRRWGSAQNARTEYLLKAQSRQTFSLFSLRRRIRICDICLGTCNIRVSCMFQIVVSATRPL